MVREFYRWHRISFVSYKLRLVTGLSWNDCRAWTKDWHEAMDDKEFFEVFK